MNININVKRTIKINGKEYQSLEEIPDNIHGAREFFRKVLDRQAAPGHGINSLRSRTRIIFNDKEYETVESMPKEVRKEYENVLKAVGEIRDSSSGIEPAKINGDWLERTGANGALEPGRLAAPAKGRSFSFPRRTSILSTLLVTLFLLLFYLVQKG